MAIINVAIIVFGILIFLSCSFGLVRSFVLSSRSGKLSSPDCHPRNAFVAIALLAASSISLALSLYAIRPFYIFNSYSLSSKKICEMRIDIYTKATSGFNDKNAMWSLSKSVYVNSREHIAGTIARLGDGEKYAISHETLTGNRYHIRFRECGHPEWINEQIIITSSTTRSSNIFLTSYRLSIVSAMSDDATMANSIGSNVVSDPQLGEWIERLASSKDVFTHEYQSD